MNKTRKSLLTSAVSLLLCCAMLVGTTFAWFTDSVTSANNKIQAGTLNVDLELLDKESNTWASIKESQEAIFDYDLWEPGYTDVKVFKIENEGTLALKWNATIAASNDLTILGNVIDVYVKADATEYPADRAELASWTSAGTLAEFIDNAANVINGNLEADASQSFAVALVMREEAGNEYQGLPLVKNNGTLDIKVIATQDTVEEDSFDETYDENAFYYDVVVSSTEELKAAVKAGHKVIALEDATYTLPAIANAEYTVVGLGDEAIINIAYATGTSTANNSITFNNVTIKGSNGIYTGIQHSNTLVYNNCTIEGASYLYAVSETFNNCTFNLTTQYLCTYSAKEVNFNNCTFNTDGKALLLYRDSGTGSAVNVNNCTFKATKTAYTSAGDACAALEIDSSYVDGYVINFTGDNVVDSDFSGLYRIKNAGATNVTVNGADASTEVNYVNTSAEYKAANVAGATIVLEEGTYDEFPTPAANTTIVGTDGAVVTATLSSTLDNVTVKNVTFEGGNTGRWAYAKGEVVFEDCTFNATSVYAIHYDGTSGADITYKNCEITGWVAIASGHNSLTFDGCTIKGNGSYGCIRTYGNTTVKNCTFDVSAVNTTDGFQDGLHAVGCEITVINCVNVNGAMEELYNTSNNGSIVEN